MSSNWVWVTPAAEIKHGSRPIAINLDVIAIIQPVGAGSRLIWHGSSPRTEWVVKEPPSEILAPGDLAP